jgi:hypothetical protein
MFHANTRPAQAWPAEDDQALPGQDHLLDVMKIEPAKYERLAEGVGLDFLQSGFEDFPAPAEAKEPRLYDFAAKTNRLVAFFVRKSGELAPVFVTAGIMREQIARRLNPKPMQLGDARARDPVHFA